MPDKPSDRSTESGQEVPPAGKPRPGLSLVRGAKKTAPSHAPPPVVTVRLCRPGASQPEEIPPADISSILPMPGILLWVDIQDPGQAELNMLCEEFRFDALAMEDVVKQRQRPKVDQYPGYSFVVLYAPLPSIRFRGVQTAEVDLFVGANYVVSVHHGNVPSLSEAMQRWSSAEYDVRSSVGFLTHNVMDSIVDAYFPIVDDIDSRLDRLEISMFRASQSANAEELLELKRSLFTLRKAIYPLREVFETFPTREQSPFDIETHPYFQDVYDHVLRLLDLIEIQRDMITDAMDAHLAFISNSLNETMKTLTVLGICVGVAGAVFGAWGMNVGGIPFRNVQLDGIFVGFWLVCALTVGLIGVALFWARRRGMW